MTDRCSSRVQVSYPYIVLEHLLSMVAEYNFIIIDDAQTLKVGVLSIY